MTHSVPRELAWASAAGDRRIGSTGWIGQHPETGADVAHLLLHPHDDVPVHRMRAFAERLSLTPADEPIGLIATAPGIYLVPAGGQAQIRRRQGDDDDLILARPATPEWLNTAGVNGWAVLTVGADAVDLSAGDHYLERLNLYLARGTRLWLGRVPVEAAIAADGWNYLQIELVVASGSLRSAIGPAATTRHQALAHVQNVLDRAAAAAQFTAVPASAAAADRVAQTWRRGAKDDTITVGSFIHAIYPCRPGEEQSGAIAWLDDLANQMRRTGVTVTVETPRQQTPSSRSHP